MGHTRTWNPVSRIPVSNDVDSRAASSMRNFFSGEASWAYRMVPSLMSRMLGLTNGCERFSRTTDCGYRQRHHKKGERERERGKY